jgi:hypothetical protein
VEQCGDVVIFDPHQTSDAMCAKSAARNQTLNGPV